MALWRQRLRRCILFDALAAQLPALASSRPSIGMKASPQLPLQHEYHDGRLDAVEFGPRRDVTLHVGLDPVWNNGDTLVRRLRFSAIKNFDHVTSFFASYAAKADEVGLDTILGIVRPTKERIGIELDRLGYVELEGAKVREL